MMPDAADRPIKRERVLSILDAHGADALVLTSQTALAWYLAGSRVHVNFAAPPLVAVRVSHQGDEVFVSSNEQQRLLAEELPAGVSLSTRAWHEALPALPGLTEADVARELRDARRHLLPVELSQYRSLSKDVSAVLTDALTAVDPAASERELAASVTRALTALGADPLVVLVAGHSRVSFRHPLPTDAPLGRRAMLIVCARRHGMIANATRWVRFGPADARETDAEARILDVEAAMLAATVPGAQLNQILAEAASAYSRAGFHAEEWTMHHQGGPAGYDGRDPRATPTTTDEVVLGQAFTWNPSAPGVKVEDTMLLTDSGFEVLTADPRWPTAVVGGLARPLTLER